jgi:hypothetical protein
MKPKWLLAIFFITIVVRLVIAFTTPNFTYESYFHLRQVEEISQNGLPLYQDDLSYGGRNLRFLPFFHYLMAVLDVFLPLVFLAKILPNLLIASLTFIVYGIAKKVTVNKNAPLYAAGIVGLLPILFTTNAFTVESLFMPLVFLAIYSFMNVDQEKYVNLYLLTFLLLTITSSATFLLLIGFGIYLILSAIERKKIIKGEVELIIFSVFFYVWVQFLFFKNILLEQGFGFIWKNIPSSLILEYFPKVSIAEALFLVSIVPFITGIFVVYRSVFRLKDRKTFLLISLAISTTILTWFRLIEFNLSLAFFGVILAILFAVFYEEVIKYFNKTKIAGAQKWFSATMIIILLLTMSFPALEHAKKQERPSEEEMRAFEWIEGNIPKGATVLTLLEEGHLLTHVGKRANLMDDQFSLVDDIDSRFKDLTSLYTTPFQTQAIDLLDKYNIKYIMYTPQAEEKYERGNFRYLAGNCFRRIYKQETRIYEVLCTLSETT